MIKKICDYFFTPDKLAISLFLLILLNSYFGIYSIEHVYYDDNNIKHIEFLNQYNNDNILKLNFSKPYEIGIKLNLFGLYNPEIIYANYLKRTTGNNNTYYLHQKTFLFSKRYNITNQFNDNNYFLKNIGE
jgi:hypothetical protein